MQRVGLVFLLATAGVDLTSAARVKQHRRTRSNASSAVNTATATWSEKCQALKDLKLGTQEVGSYISLLCELWPSSWGEFPSATIKDVNGLADAAFKPGGAYDQVKTLAADRLVGGSFCWRKNAIRPKQVPKSYSCPEVFEYNNLYETALKVEPKTKDDHTFCEKDCDSICGPDYNRGDGKGNVCVCQQLHMGDMGAFPSVYRRVIDASPEGCGIVFNGKCYDECPQGYKASFMLGYVLPVCQVTCENTERPFECGMGCTNSKANCSSTTASQVGEVMSIIGQGASLVTGNTVIAAAADSLAGVVTFSIAVIGRMIKTVITAFFSEQKKKQEKAAFLAAMLKLVANEINDNVAVMKEKYGDYILLMSELVVAFKHWRWTATAHDLVNTVLKSGTVGLMKVYKLLQAFLWPVCPLSADTRIEPPVEEEPDVDDPAIEEPPAYPFE